LLKGRKKRTTCGICYRGERDREMKKIYCKNVGITVRGEVE